MPSNRPIDIIKFLDRIVQEHVQGYRSDFAYDIADLTQSAVRGDVQERTFYWMGRECGTWCFKERDVLLKGSEQYRTWLHYAADAAKIKAFRVTVVGMENCKVMGYVCPIQYEKQVERLERVAVSSEDELDSAIRQEHSTQGKEARERAPKRKAHDTKTR